ncbi:MAG: putative signal transducing protein [Planctomycetota bacterium]
MAEKLVTIAQFANYIEAEVARQPLEGDGIEAVATGTNASNIYSVSAVEEPELLALESKAQKAREILESHRGQEQ